MNRRRFIAASCTSAGVGAAGCLGGRSAWGSNRDSSPAVEWRTSEGHTEAMGGDRLVIFDHEGGDTVDTSDATIEPVHDDRGRDIDRDVRFMNHEPGTVYGNGDDLIVVIPESEPQPEFGEYFAIEWTAPDETATATIGEHFWGENYRDDIP